MDQSKPSEDHCLHSPNLPENVMAAPFNFYNSHYLAHQPENSQCPPPLSHQNSSITVPNIQHHQSQSVPEFAPNVPSQQISYRHELIYSLSKQQKLLQYQMNYRTQRQPQQPHCQYIRQQLSDIQMIQLPNFHYEQDDPLMNSETQTSIYQTDLINFQSQQRPIQHRIPHVLSTEFTQPPKYTRETRIDDSDDDNLELEGSSNKTAQSLHAKNKILSSDKKGLNPEVQILQKKNSELNAQIGVLIEANLGIKKTPEFSAELIQEKDDQISKLELANKKLTHELDSIQQQEKVRELNNEVRPKETETTLLQQKYDALEKVHNNMLSVEEFLRSELQKQNRKAADMVSKITNLKLELDISKKTAQTFGDQNEILSSENENLKKQVQTLQTETQHQNAKIGALAEENLGIEKSLALSKQEVDSIQQQNRANEQVIEMLRIENNKLPGLKEKVESLTTLQRKMNDDKEELDKEVEGYKKEVTSLSHEVEEVEIKFRRDLKKEMQKVENELKDVVHSNENLKVEVRNLTAENKYLNETVEAEAKKHKDQIIFLFSIIKSRKNVIIDLRNKNLEMTMSSSKNRPKSNKLLESNQEYEQTLASASATIQKTLKENVELKQELANEKINAEQKSKYTSKIKNLAKELKAKNEVLSTELGQLSAQLNNKSKRNIELQMEKDSSNKTNTEHCSKIQELTRELRVQGATNENNLQEKQHEIESQKVQIHNQKRSLESHKSKISELQNADAENVKKLKMTEDNFKHQLKGLHAYYKSKEIDWKAKEGTKYANKKNEMQKQAIQEMEKKMTEVHAENKEMEKKMSEVHAENNEMEKKMTEGHAENKEMEKMMTEVHAENKEMEIKMIEVHAENKEMEKKMSELRAKNKELKCKHESFIQKETIERLQEEQRRHFETTIKGVDDDVKVLCSKMTPGADSNLERRLGASNKVVSKDDCKVRVGPSTEGFRSVITVTTRLAKGKNQHRHQGLNPPPLMSLRLPNPFTLEHTTVLHKPKEGDIDHTSHISKMNRIIGGVKHDNDKNETTLKRKLCNEEADKCQLQQETQLSPDSTYEVKNESVAPFEETAAKKNPNDCEYPPKKRICVNEGNIPMGLDEANGLDELEEGEIP